MPPQFLGNPLDCKEFWNGDTEVNVDEEWITLPHDAVLMEVRNPHNLTIDITQSDDDTVWLDEEDETDYNIEDDADYNPDEDYNFQDVFDGDADEIEISEDSNLYDFYNNFGVDEDDYVDLDEDYADDYVTYDDIASPNPSTLSETNSSIKSPAESNFDNLTTDPDTD